jgi:hypothetical protein
MVDFLTEESYNVRLIDYLLYCGQPLRAIDFYNEVGRSAGISINANIKALKRLVKWNVLSFDGSRYSFTSAFRDKVGFISNELTKKVGIVR